MGDRLRFGATFASRACMLGFLDSKAVATFGEEAILEYAFPGPALDKPSKRLGRLPRSSESGGRSEGALSTPRACIRRPTPMNRRRRGRLSFGGSRRLPI